MKKIKTFLINFWPLFGYFLISIILLSPLLIRQGIPFKYDWGWPIFSMSEYWNHLFDTSNFGIFSIAGKYLNLIMGLPSIFHLTPSMSLKLFLLAIHTLSGYGFFLFLRRCGVSKFVSFVSGIAYAFSPYIFIRMAVGFTTSLVAYAILPFFIDRFTNLKIRNWRNFFLLGFLLTLIFSQIQAGVLTLLLIFVWILIPADHKILDKIKQTSLLALAMIIVNLPLLLLYFIFQNKSLIPSGADVTTLNFIASLPHSLRNTLMLSDHSVTVGYFYPFARKLIVVVGFGLIYLIALFSIANKKNRALALTLIVPFCIVLPFSLGPTGIFSHIYIFFFDHVKQITLFRETYHFLFILSFSLIGLFALGCNHILYKINSRFGKIIFRLIMVFLVTVIIWPFFIINSVGYLKLQKIPNEYKEANKFFHQNKEYCSKAYYPPNLGFVYFLDDNSLAAANSDLIAYAFGYERVTDAASYLNLPTPEMFYRNELTSHFLDLNDNGDSLSIMRSAGVDCVIIRADMGSKFWQVSGLNEETDQSIKDKWQNNNMLLLTQSKKGLYLDKKFGDKIFVYKIDSKSEPPVSQEPSFSLLGTDLSLASLAYEFSDFRNGWTRGRYFFWRKLIFADLRQDFVYTNKPNSVISGNVPETGSYDLWVRHMDGGNPGSIQLTVDSKQFTIAKDPGEERFVWKDLGNINIQNGDFSIKNISGENAIADIVLVEN